MSTDLLKIDFINSLPQPLWVDLSGTFWPVHDICVETGLLRIDVCGLLEVSHIGSVHKIKDSNGELYETDDFYVEQP